MWKDTAKEGFSRLVDDFEEHDDEFLHVRVSVGEGDVELMGAGQEVAGMELCQIVVMAPDGSESVVEHCLPRERADAYVESYNFVGPRSGHICEARPYSSCFTRDTNGKVHALLCV